MGLMWSPHRRAELRTIGWRRFAGKGATLLLKRLRHRWSRPAPWTDTLFWRDDRASALAGRWLYGAGASPADLAAFRAECMSRATLADEGRFAFNGASFCVYEPPMCGHWDADPLTGARWPNFTPFEAIPHQPGDIRFPFELGRMHHLCPMAQAWRLTGDGVWPARIIRDVAAVLSVNGFERGVHWIDGLQLAIRIFSFAAAADLCHDAGSDLHQCLNNAVFGQAVALRRQLSPESSATNNHAIGEAAGLCLAGLFLDRHRFGTTCRREGERMLRRELGRQIYADGVPYEGTTPYIRFDLEFLLLLILAYRGRTLAVPEWLERHARAMATALSALADARGRVPPVGDGDDGRVLRLDSEPYLTVNETLHLAERVLGVAGLAPAESGHGFAHWCAGPGRSGGRAPAPLTAHLASSGLIHLRRGPLDLWLDCGPTGLGPRGHGGHGHNDTGAIVVHLDGVGLLHDPGWYTYYKNRVLRDQLRGTKAHNSITIDGEEQARLLGMFAIENDCRPTRPRVRRFGERAVAIVCGHTGYDRLGKGIQYRRFVVFSGGEAGPWTVRVTDRIRSAAPATVRAHLGSDLDWRAEAETVFALGTAATVRFLRPVTGAAISPAPFSRSNGELQTGSALDWTLTGRDRDNARAAPASVGRWVLSVAPPPRRHPHGNETRVDR